MGSVDINVRKGENSKIFLVFFFFLTMFENHISQAIEKNQDSSGIWACHWKQQFNQAALDLFNIL